MKRKYVSRFFYLLLFSALLAGGFVVYKYLTILTPEKEIKHAIESLAMAKKSEANLFAADKFKEATAAFNEAMNEWQVQNKKIFLYRDYVKTIAFAKKSIDLSREATLDASSEMDSTNEKSKYSLEDLLSKTDRFEKYYKNLPLQKSTFDNFSKARLKYQEASDNFRENRSYEALKLAGEGERLINNASSKAKKLLEDYYNDYPLWRKNAELARHLSSRGQIVILINKLEATCTVLKSGKSLEVFSAEFGKNWTGDKIRKGDKATPEGVYKVIKKKSGAKTKYYKSLLLNYPNNEDKARFSSLVKKGVIPKNSKIGNLIEIHGEGGKGVFWTDGCIALSNSDMDKVFSLCKVSTPVIIIGSEKPLQEYFK